MVPDMEWAWPAKDALFAIPGRSTAASVRQTVFSRPRPFHALPLYLLEKCVGCSKYFMVFPMTKYGFPPVIDKHARVLILGSMPGEESLAKNQYYANPRNAFWFILGQLLGFDHGMDYRSRTRMLQEGKIALWDVLSACQRKGSLDSAIKNESIRVNDFETLLGRYSSIETIFFNGAKAEVEYLKRILPALKIIDRDIHCHRLVSTSPAMAMMTREQKLAEWQVVLESVK